MKKIFFLVLFCCGLTTKVLAQRQYVLEKSNVRFFSHAPLEDIEANTPETKGVIDFEKKNCAFKIPITSFVFKSSLMKSHFNENYMESEKHPFGGLKGEIQGQYTIEKDGDYTVNVVGDLEIHGVVQRRNIPATIYVKNGVITIYARFMVKLADHKIKIPSVVFQNIAEEVEVTITGNCKSYQK